MSKKDENLSWGRKGEDEERLRKPVALTEAADEMEAAVIRSLLESCGIPSRLRNTGIGAYMGVVLGTNRFGIVIEVAEGDLETARKILAARPLSDEGAAAVPEPAETDVPPPAEEEKREPDAATDPEPVESSRKLLLLLLLIGIPLLAALVLRIAGVL